MDLTSETERLLEFGHAAVAAEGFAALDAQGRPVEGPRELWIACRMTHVYALGHLLGHPGSAEIVDHGLAAIGGSFADTTDGGWFASVGADGAPLDTTKAAYPHAFVILAASSATVAGRPGGADLLAEALAVSERHFWDESAGMVVEEWDRSFEHCDDYRGVNANMHTVEAYLAAADVSGDDRWLDRAVRITTRVVHGFARENHWRLPEHFDAHWRPLPDYNADQPAHPFRPFGATIGHGFEWSRLTLHARAALAARGQEPPGWMLDDAVALFEASARDGWAVDGADGFVYTVDWSGRPVVRARMHWVVAEALAAASVVSRVTSDPRHSEFERLWWDHAERHFVDRVHGSWWHELDPELSPASSVWGGKPDLYHAVQATLVPRLPLEPSLASALRHEVGELRE